VASQHSGATRDCKKRRVSNSLVAWDALDVEAAVAERDAAIKRMFSADVLEDGMEEHMEPCMEAEPELQTLPFMVDIDASHTPPKMLALKLMESATLNQTQVQACAPIVFALQQIWERRSQPSLPWADGHVDKPAIVLWLGAGGSGKTWCYTKVVQALFNTYFKPDNVLAMAPTHAAVRLLGKGAMTMHKAVQARFGQSWTKEALELNGEALKEMRSRWNPLMATVIDELSMAAPEVYHALGFRSALARRVEHDLDVDKYMQQWFGKMPIGIQLGDFMQLRPATKRSLCEWIDETFTEEELNAAGESTASELGRYLFKDSFTHVVQFHGTGRFSTCIDG